MTLGGSVGKVPILEWEVRGRIIEPLGHGLELISSSGGGRGVLSNMGGGVNGDFLPLERERGAV